MEYANIRAIAFDAVGTLIDPYPGVAAAYRNAAGVLGLDLPEETIRVRFAKAFARDENADGHRTDEARERLRWRAIVGDCLPELSPDQADAAFESLWTHFAEARNWRLFPDSAEAIHALANAGYRLCVASNFDSRLRQVWAGLVGDTLPLSNLVISSEVGCRKPGATFYDAVTKALDMPASEILFVGDDFENDFRVPRLAGFEAVLVDRRGRFGESDSVVRLTELPDFLRAGA